MKENNLTIKLLNIIKNAKYENSIIGILDILGFKNALKDESCNTLNELKKMIADNVFINGEFLNFNNVSIYILSDTFIVYANEISFFTIDAIIKILENIRYDLMNDGFLSRGSIVQGKHFLDEGLLISPAFLKAYLIEEKECIYPRIIIENKIVEAYKQYKIKEKRKNTLPNNIIKQDFDGYLVVRPFIQLREIAAFCEKGYFNTFCSRDDPFRLKEMFENQIENLQNKIKICCEKIDKNSPHLIAKLNYVINDYNQILDLCQNFPNKEFLTSSHLAMKELFN